MGVSPEVQAYWDAYLATLPASAGEQARTFNMADQFGDTVELADQLSALILNGIKTATCSGVWEWEAEGLDLPRVGFRQIVLDGHGRPVCIIETTEVFFSTFDEVDAAFASDEGEDDRSLESWRTGHWRYFERALPSIGHEPAHDMPLVCERFRVIHKNGTYIGATEPL